MGHYHLLPARRRRPRCRRASKQRNKVSPSDVARHALLSQQGIPTIKAPHASQSLHHASNHIGPQLD
jgi:hypothetical protein